MIFDAPFRFILGVDVVDSIGDRLLFKNEQYAVREGACVEGSGYWPIDTKIVHPHPIISLPKHFMIHFIPLEHAALPITSP